MDLTKEKGLGYWCNFAAMSFRNLLEERTRELGVNVSEGVVLHVLWKKGPASLATLAKAMRHAHPSVLRNIDSLEDQGYVHRVQHPEDRRVKLVELTDAGRSLIPNINEAIASVHEDARLGFSDEEVQQLINSLHRIILNLGDPHDCCDEKINQSNHRDSE
ncbi:MarR family transcriptional regulator [bacterium]|nr:MarR family transcriptional regulator [bacterium]